MSASSIAHSAQVLDSSFFSEQNSNPPDPTSSPSRLFYLLSVFLCPSRYFHNLKLCIYSMIVFLR